MRRVAIADSTKQEAQIRRLDFVNCRPNMPAFSEPKDIILLIHIVALKFKKIFNYETQSTRRAPIITTDKNVAAINAPPQTSLP